MSFSSALRGVAFYALSVVPVVLAVDKGVASVAYVQGKSMTPTLNAGYPNLLPKLSHDHPKHSSAIGIKTKQEEIPDTNEIIFVRKLMYAPTRGDVVVLEAPGKPGQRVVKRLIATEGDVIAYFEPTYKKSLATIRYEVEADQRLEDLAASVPTTNDMQEILEELNLILKNRREQQKPAITLHSDINNEPLSSQHQTQEPEILPTTPTPTTITTNHSNEDKVQHTFNNMEDTTNKRISVLFEDVQLRVVRIPEGHCWVEGDNPEVSRDSREYGPVPLGLIQGGVLGVVWPPSLIGWIRPHTSTTNIICIFIIFFTFVIIYSFTPSIHAFTTQKEIISV